MTTLTLSEVDDFELADLRRALSAAGADPDAIITASATEPLEAGRVGEPTSMLVHLAMQTDPNVIISVLALWLLKRRAKTRSSEVITETLPDGTKRSRTVKLDQSASEAPAAPIIAQITGWLKGSAAPKQP